MVLASAAKETGIKEMLNIKDNNNGKKNRFILTPCGKFFCSSALDKNCIFSTTRDF